MIYTVLKYMRLVASRTTIIVMLLVPTKKAISQRDDYIVNLNNDTFYGVITFIHGMATRLLTESNDYPIDVKTVDSYFSAGHRLLFRRKILPGKENYYLLLCLDTGRINLYSSDVKAVARTKQVLTYFAEKEKNRLVEVWTNRRLFGDNNIEKKEAMKNLIKDNPA